MVCSNCGHPVGPDDQYCGGCGAYLTDAPEEGTGREHPDETTQDLAQDNQWDIPYAPAETPSPRRSGPSTGLIAAAVAAVVLVAFLLFSVLRPDADESTASGAATTQATTATTEAGTAAPSDPTATSTDSPTEAPPAAEIELPGSAEQCSNVGSFLVYRGNTTTSCPFAENVGRAFAEVAQPVTAEATLSDVSSPVTGLDYDLTCEFTTPVRCTGGDNAVVYLVAAS